MWSPTSQCRQSLDTLHHISAYSSTQQSNGLDSPARGSLPIEEGRVVVDTLRTNSSGDRGDLSIPSVTTPHTYNSNDDDFVANDSVPEPEAWPTAEFKEGPAVGPTTEFQEGPVAPTLPLDSDWYKNRTVEAVDAHFASVIAASLKAQGAAFRQRQVIPPAGAITLDEADDNMPSLLPPGVCNSDAKDNNDPPAEASIASRAGRCGQGTSLLSYANQVASRVLPSTMKEHAELAVDLAKSIDPHTSGDPGSDPTPFLPKPPGLYKVLKQPIATRQPWIQSLVKELKGLVKDRGASKKELPGLNDTVVPVKEVFKCKLDQHGNVDKLKARIIFRGDLYTPTTNINSWNPHATWPALQLYLAVCTKFGMYPSQADWPTSKLI